MTHYFGTRQDLFVAVVELPFDPEQVIPALLAPHHLGGDQPELRAALTAAQVPGLAFARHVVGVPRLADAPPDELVAAIGPVLEHYLTGDLSPAGG